MLSFRLANSYIAACKIKISRDTKNIRSIYKNHRRDAYLILILKYIFVYFINSVKYIDFSSLNNIQKLKSNFNSKYGPSLSNFTNFMRIGNINLFLLLTNTFTLPFLCTNWCVLLTSLYSLNVKDIYLSECTSHNMTFPKMLFKKSYFYRLLWKFKTRSTKIKGVQVLSNTFWVLKITQTVFNHPCYGKGQYFENRQ